MRLRTQLATIVAAVAIGSALITVPVATVAAPAEVTSVPAQIARQSIVHDFEMTEDVSGKIVVKVDGKTVTAPASPATATASFPFNGWKFRGLYMCQDNNIGTYYPLQAAGNYYEYNGSGIGMAHAGTETAANCASYADNQTIHYSIYRDDSTICWKVNASWNTVNGWNLYNHVDALINNFVNRCSDTAQHRANMASRLTGYALGLLGYHAAADNCIMNDIYIDGPPAYSYAGVCEDNRIDWLYN